jgi:putative N6-adenine-specific DNA methylase
LYTEFAVLYRDLSGVSLYQRGYRDVVHKASLNEGITATVLTLASLKQAVLSFGGVNDNASSGHERVLLDPMCGSNTFIEATLMASNVAPGLLRR